MKILLVSASIVFALFLVFQIYTTMATSKSETQAYQVVRVEEQFEIRHYPAAIMAKISSTSKSYRDLGYSGFSKLAQYIFGGNSDKKQIAMTSPVHMDIGDTISTMAFVMPSYFKMEDLPAPNNSEVQIETSAPEYVAVIQFGGFANTVSIHKHSVMLEKLLKEKGISYHGNFRFLGYNPPYQIFGRRNEIIVAVSPDGIK
jgi:hypothetical protein